jgi:integrase
MDAAMRERLLAYGGLRIGEARALRRRHIDVLGGKLIVDDVYRHPGLG